MKFFPNTYDFQKYLTEVSEKYAKCNRNIWVASNEIGIALIIPSFEENDVC